mmetsp:Transcript_50161/g.93906  ORF Transcript_50161/g.93906 Transcript_50161/m.93906 type:complete len:369 (-) Transcript_50161:35-1141(-)
MTSLVLENKLDFYKILCVEPSADAADIRRAYRQAALATHPDKGGNSNDFHAISVAFEVLSCDITRKEYDNKIQDIGPCNVKKRYATEGCIQDPHPKRQRSCNMARMSKKDAEAASRASNALESLRDILQEMSRPERLLAVSSMPLHIRIRLASFMEQPAAPCTKNKTKLDYTRDTCPSPSFMKPGRGVWVVKGKQCTRYKARVNFHSLCVYGRWQANAETAIEHQIALVRIRNAVMSSFQEDPMLLRDSAWFDHLCKCILAECEVQASDIGLSAYVTVRGFGCRVESPSLSLAEAWALRTRLVNARATSWTAFREEWVRLLCRGRRRSSRAEAESLVERNRREALRRQFSRALTFAARLDDLGPTASR